MKALAHGLPIACHPILQCVRRHLHPARNSVPRSYAVILACQTPCHRQVEIGNSALTRDTIFDCSPFLRVVHAQAWHIRTPCRASATRSQSYELPNAQTPSERTGDLFLYNTMSRKKERVHAHIEGEKKLSMYCCGVTVYDLSHIGSTIVVLLNATNVPVRVAFPSKTPNNER